MCFNLEEADAIIAAEKASGVKYMVGMMKRQDPAYQYVLPLIKELDDVHLVRVHDFGGDYTINGEIYDEVHNDDLPKEVRDEMADSNMRKMIKGIGEDRKELGVAYSTLLYLMVHDAILLQEALGGQQRFNMRTFITTILSCCPEFGEDIRAFMRAGCSLNAGIGMSG